MTAASGRETETETDVYELTCIDCTFEATVEGTVYDVFDVVDTHQERHSDTRPEHFVNFERSG